MNEIERILDDYFTKNVNYQKTIERLKAIGASRTLTQSLPQGVLFDACGKDETDNPTIQ